MSSMTEPRRQYSIRRLFWVTTLVAIVCALLRNPAHTSIILMWGLPWLLVVDMLARALLPEDWYA